MSQLMTSTLSFDDQQAELKRRLQLGQSATGTTGYGVMEAPGGAVKYAENQQPPGQSIAGSFTPTAGVAAPQAPAPVVNPKVDLYTRVAKGDTSALAELVKDKAGAQQLLTLAQGGDANALAKALINPLTQSVARDIMRARIAREARIDTMDAQAKVQKGVAETRTAVALDLEKTRQAGKLVFDTAKYKAETEKDKRNQDFQREMLGIKGATAQDAIVNKQDSDSLKAISETRNKSLGNIVSLQMQITSLESLKAKAAANGKGTEWGSPTYKELERRQNDLRGQVQQEEGRLTSLDEQEEGIYKRRKKKPIATSQPTATSQPAPTSRPTATAQPAPATQPAATTKPEGTSTSYGYPNGMMERSKRTDTVYLSPNQPTSAPTGQSVAEGTVIVNKATGQRKVMRNGQWVDVGASAK